MMVYDFDRNIVQFCFKLKADHLKKLDLLWQINIGLFQWERTRIKGEVPEIDRVERRAARERGPVA